MEIMLKTVQMALVYFSIFIPSLGFWFFLAPSKEGVRNWIVVLWILLSLIIPLHFLSSFAIFPILGYLVLLRATLEVGRREGSPLSAALGPAIAVFYHWLHGFDLFGVSYPAEVIGAGLLVAFLSPNSSVPDVILVSSLALSVLPEEIFRTLYPLAIFSAVSIAMRDFFVAEFGERRILFAMRIKKLASIISVALVALTYMSMGVYFVDYYERKVEEDFSTQLEIYESALEKCVEGREIREILKDETFRDLTIGPERPRFVKGVVFRRGGKEIVLVLPSGKGKEMIIEGRDYDLVVYYEPPSGKALELLFIHMLTTVGVIIGSFTFIIWLNNRIWGSLLEEEIAEKTLRLSAANEQLTAMNEQLVSMNEEIEDMYRSISDLNTRVVEFLEFLKGIRIDEDTGKIFSEIFEVIKSISSVMPVGYEVIGRDGTILKSYGSRREVRKDLKLGNYTMRIYYPSTESFTEDEESFLEIISAVGEIIIAAHDNYVSVERSKRFLAKVLDLLDIVLLVESREEAEKLLLKHMMNLFDDTVVVAIGWSDSIERGMSLPVKFLRRGEKDVEVWHLKDRGIMRRVLLSGEEYVVDNVFEDSEFVVSDRRSRSAVALPLKTAEGVFGVVEIDRSTVGAFSEEDLKVLRVFVRIVAMTLQRIKLYEDLKATFLDTVEALSYAIELKDPYTRGHSRRVANYAMAIARRMGLPRKTIETIEIAALLHDIGKIGVRGAVLNKPTRLTRDEYEEIMKHPVLGEELVKKIRHMKYISKIIRHHHEHYGGGGYPDGLKGEEIPLESRIIAVADAFDAMTSDRPYRRALSVSKAIEILEKNENMQWDPKIVRVAVEVFREMFADELEDEDGSR